MIRSICRLADLFLSVVGADYESRPEPPAAWPVPKTFPRSVARRRAVVAGHGCVAAW